MVRLVLESIINNFSYLSACNEQDITGIVMKFFGFSNLHNF